MSSSGLHLILKLVERHFYDFEFFSIIFFSFKIFAVINCVIKNVWKKYCNKNYRVLNMRGKKWDVITIMYCLLTFASSCIHRAGIASKLVSGTILKLPNNYYYYNFRYEICLLCRTCNARAASSCPSLSLSLLLWTFTVSIAGVPRQHK